jgi:hypothetical protein
MKRTTTRALKQGLLSVVVLGALGAPTAARAEDTSAPNETPSSAPDQWLLMDTLHGTAVGTFMEENRINLYGWTEGSFTASSAGNATSPFSFRIQRTGSSSTKTGSCCQFPRFLNTPYSNSRCYCLSKVCLKNGGIDKPWALPTYKATHVTQTNSTRQ